jgi:hypothetical protein
VFNWRYLISHPKIRQILPLNNEIKQKEHCSTCEELGHHRGSNHCPLKEESQNTDETNNSEESQEILFEDMEEDENEIYNMEVDGETQLDEEMGEKKESATTFAAWKTEIQQLNLLGMVSRGNSTETDG